jgi:aminotransferase
MPLGAIVRWPGSDFFREPEHRFLRFHFAKKEATLRAAGDKLLRLNPDQAWERGLDL